MKKILIIEDELNIFELIKFNLEAQGFEVAGVHEGTGAVEKIVDKIGRASCRERV